MNEDTIIKTLELPHGEEWAWFADANLVVLSPRLDAAGRERALTEVQAHWRRRCLRVVEDAATEPLMGRVPCPEGSTVTQPLAGLTARGV